MDRGLITCVKKKRGEGKVCASALFIPKLGRGVKRRATLVSIFEKGKKKKRQTRLPHGEGGRKKGGRRYNL